MHDLDDPVPGAGQETRLEHPIQREDEAEHEGAEHEAEAAAAQGVRDADEPEDRDEADADQHVDADEAFCRTEPKEYTEN